MKIDIGLDQGVISNMKPRASKVGKKIDYSLVLSKCSEFSDMENKAQKEKWGFNYGD